MTWCIFKRRWNGLTKNEISWLVQILYLCFLKQDYTIMILDRKTPPQFKTADKVNIFQAKENKLSNSIPVYVINAGDQDVVKADFTFNAGAIYAESPLIANAANSMLNDGTLKMNSSEIAEKLDFYGAFLNGTAGNHTSTLTLYSLGKHFEKCLEIVEDMLFNACYPEHEFEVYRNAEFQHFSVNQQKPSVLGRARFFEALFGADHPYGKQTVADDFKSLKVEDVRAFHKSTYRASNMRIVLSGKIDESHIAKLEKFFGSSKTTEVAKQPEMDFTPQSSEELIHFIEKKDAVQAAVRAGKILFNKLHPDFIKLKITNTVLGGYFGSRLMSNIREDKGYTYGIGSGVISMFESGFFVISTEVGTDVAENTVTEIRKELKILRTELVSETELERVRNYLLGDMMQNADGAFALADIFTSLHNYGLDYSYFDSFVDTIKTITPQDILDTAAKYLHEDSMYFVTVGKKL